MKAPRLTLPLWMRNWIASAALPCVRRLAARDVLLATAISALLALCFTLALETVLDRPAIQRDTEWLSHPGSKDYVSCFRLDVKLPSTPAHAWLRVSAWEAFELTINGNTVARSFLWRPSRPYQNGLSEAGQRAQPFTPLLFLNLPREHQWGECSWWQVPTYVDVRPYLKAGDNVIALEVETRQAPASMCVVGEIQTLAGDVIPIGTRDKWTVSNVQEYGRDDWTKPSIKPDDWTEAVPTASPYASRVCLLPTGVFTQPWLARWIPLPEWNPGRSITLRSVWKLDEDPVEAWVRIATNQPYDLLINGKPVRPPGVSRSALDSSLWILGTSSAVDPYQIPELLDPDEAEQLFPGQQYFSQSHSDPTVNDFHKFENRENRTQDRPDANKNGIVGLETVDPDTVSNGTTSVIPIPQASPLSLARTGSKLAFDGYGVSRLLRRGDNVIELRMRARTGVPEKPFFPRVAMDGGITMSGDRNNSFGFPEQWTQHDAASSLSREPVVKDLNAVPLTLAYGDVPGASELASPLLIPLRYHGEARVFSTKAGVGLLLFLATMSVLTIWQRATAGSDEHERGRRGALVTCSAVFAGVLVFRLAQSERAEALLFLFPEFWLASIALALAAATIAWVILSRRILVDLVRNRPDGTTCGPAIRPRLRRMTYHLLVAAALVAILVLTTVVRWYKADGQPIDDDEFASLQAVLAIAETGAPMYSADVWYTRSPVYHYAAAAYGMLFGFDIFTMRGFSVLLATATAGLIYLFGARILRSPSAGLIAALFFAVHPFAIFSAHIARFYQIQQFFALATLYFLVRGFIQTDGTQRQRMLCLFSLVATVLSQEISLTMIPLVGAAVAICGRPLSRRDIISLGIVSAGCLGLIALDLVIFKVRCVTSSVGVSPNVEATLMPHFNSPMNYFSVLLGYSRLDLSGTIILAATIAAGVWRSTRIRGVILALLAGGIIATNILVYGESLRYQFWLLPPLLLLVAVAIRSWGRWTAAYLRSSMAGTAIMLVPIAVVVLAYSPWRVASSYDSRILGDSASAFGYVRTHLRPGDKVAATEPHPHAAKLETGRCDFDLAFPLLHDFTYMKDGRLLDRNGNAQVVSTVQELQRVMVDNDRVWIVINREKMRTRGRNVRWEYAGARAEELLRANCKITFRSYLWTVYLWDAQAGNVRTYRAGF